MSRRNSTWRASSACTSETTRAFTRHVAATRVCALERHVKQHFSHCRPAHEKHDQRHPIQSSTTPDTSDAVIAFDMRTSRRLWQRQVTSDAYIAGWSTGHTLNCPLSPDVCCGRSTRRPTTNLTANAVPPRGGAMDAPGPTVVHGRLYVMSGYGLWGGKSGNVLLAFALGGD